MIDVFFILPTAGWLLKFQFVYIHAMCQFNTFLDIGFLDFA